MEELERKCRKIRKSIQEGGQSFNNELFVVLNENTGRTESKTYGDNLISLLETARNSTKTAKKTDRPYLVLCANADKSTAADNFVFLNYRIFNEKHAANIKNLVNCIEDRVSNFEPFVEIGQGKYTNMFGPKQEIFDFENIEHEGRHEELATACRSLSTGCSLRFSHFVSLIRTIVSSQYCAKCLRAFLGAIDTVERVVKMFTLLSRGFWSPRDQKKMEQCIDWTDDSDRKYKPNQWRLNPHNKLLTLSDPTPAFFSPASSSSYNLPSSSESSIPDNPVEDRFEKYRKSPKWHQNLMHEVIEFLDDSLVEIRNETDFNKMEELERKIMKVTSLKVGVTQYLLESGNSKNELKIDKFGFETGFSEMDKELEKTAARLLRNRNLKLTPENLMAQIRPDLARRFRTNLSFNFKIIQTITKKIGEIYQRIHSQRSGNREKSRNSPESDDSTAASESVFDDDDDDDVGLQESATASKNLASKNVVHEEPSSSLEIHLNQQEKARVLRVYEKMWRRLNEGDYQTALSAPPSSSSPDDSSHFCVFCFRFSRDTCHGPTRKPHDKCHRYVTNELKRGGVWPAERRELLFTADHLRALLRFVEKRKKRWRKKLDEPEEASTSADYYARAKREKEEKEKEEEEEAVPKYWKATKSARRATREPPNPVEIDSEHSSSLKKDAKRKTIDREPSQPSCSSSSVVVATSATSSDSEGVRKRETSRIMSESESGHEQMHNAAAGDEEQLPTLHYHPSLPMDETKWTRDDFTKALYGNDYTTTRMERSEVVCSWEHFRDNILKEYPKVNDYVPRPPPREPEEEEKEEQEEEEEEEEEEGDEDVPMESTSPHSSDTPSSSSSSDRPGPSNRRRRARKHRTTGGRSDDVVVVDDDDDDDEDDEEDDDDAEYDPIIEQTFTVSRARKRRLPNEMSTKDTSKRRNESGECSSSSSASRRPPNDDGDDIEFVGVVKRATTTSTAASARDASSEATARRLDRNPSFETPRSAVDDDEDSFTFNKMDEEEKNCITLD